MLLPCVRPDQVSVAPVAARWLDRGQDVEVQIGDRLERLRGRRAAQRLRQGVDAVAELVDLQAGYAAWLVASSFSVT